MLLIPTIDKGQVRYEVGSLFRIKFQLVSKVNKVKYKTDRSILCSFVAFGNSLVILMEVCNTRGAFVFAI